MTLQPMRWWDVDGVMDLERDLFGDECWTVAMFWSELAEPKRGSISSRAMAPKSSATQDFARTPKSRSCRRLR